MSVAISQELLDQIAEGVFHDLIDYDQAPWLISDTAVPIMGWWDQGLSAVFDPTVQGMVSAALLLNGKIEVTLLDGALLAAPITECTYMIPGNLLTFSFDFWLDRG